MKRILSLFMALCMLSTVCLSSTAMAYAAQEWSCGTGVVASFDDISTLTVKGNGAISDYNSPFDTPWSSKSVNYKIQSLIIENGITAVGNHAFQSLLELRNVDIASTVESIGERAFSGCRSIETVTIPASVTNIGNAAFRTASTGLSAELRAINVDSENKNYVSVDGILYDKAQTLLIQIPSSSAVKELIVPKTVTSISTQAGVNCTNLEKVTISGNVTEIKDLTFAKCSSLKEVSLSKSISVISMNAFKDCNSLEKIVIANNNCTIPNGAIPNAQGVTIYANKDSSAHKYAKDNNIAFKLIDGSDDNDVPFEPDVPPHTHSYTDTVTPPTCTEKGYTTHTCECGHNYTDNYVNAAGHSWDKGTVTKGATCTSTGIKTYTCTACGVTRTESIAKASHRVVTDKAVSATCTTAGKTAGSHCSVCGMVINPQKTVAKKAHTYKSYTTKATTKKNGSVVTKCTVCGAVKSKSTVYYPKTIKLSKTSYTYNGKVQTPSVTVKDSKGKTLKKNTDYTVTYAKGRKNVGQYAVKITFKGKYSGSKTLYYTIKPKSTSLSKVTAGKKRFVARWKKQTTQTTGYQIQYSTSSKFKSAKTVTVSKNKTTSKSISKLKAKKKYYVRIRTYKTVGKTKYYSSWSKAKTVTTKK